jgi:hypothetical protein
VSACWDCLARPRRSSEAPARSGNTHCWGFSAVTTGGIPGRGYSTLIATALLVTKGQADDGRRPHRRRRGSGRRSSCRVQAGRERWPSRDGAAGADPGLRLKTLAKGDHLFGPSPVAAVHHARSRSSLRRRWCSVSPGRCGWACSRTTCRRAPRMSSTRSALWARCDGRDGGGGAAYR